MSDIVAGDNPTSADVSGSGGGLMAAASAFLGSPLGAALGSIGSGLFNRHSARSDRKHAEYLANTSYQRAAQDLQKAGLNRVLALGSPAASPVTASGAMGDVGQAGVAGEAVRQKRSMLDSERALIDAQIDNLAAQESSAKAAADAQRQSINESKAREEAARSGKLKTEEDTRGARIQNDIDQMELDMYENMGGFGRVGMEILGSVSSSAKDALSRILRARAKFKRDKTNDEFRTRLETRSERESDQRIRESEAREMYYDRR